MTRLCNQSWLAAVLLACSAAVAQSSPEAVVVTVEDGQAVVLTSVDARLADSWLEIDLPVGGSLRILDVTLESSGGAKALVGASSEYLFAACLRGDIQASGLSASAGWVIVWKHDAEIRPAVRRFSARDLQVTLSQKNRPVDDMDALVEAEKGGRFWGRLRSSSINIGTPLQPTAEALRRDYLRQPLVMSIRREAAEPVITATARAAASALQRRDPSALAQLLTPEYFRDAAAKGQLNDARLQMAQQILSQVPADQVEPDKLQHDENPGTFSAPAGDRSIRIEIGGFDSGYFVTAIR